jgi:4a-hydroxytetrahydrobiopterin dehydratase
MTRLPDDELEAALRELPDWTREGDALVRDVRRQSWRDAIDFVNEIAREADERNHHPDVCVVGYRTVTLKLTSHDAGGITERDLSFARWIEESIGRS